MLLKSAGVSKQLVADWADVGLLASVRAHVDLEIGIVAKRLVT